MYSCVDVKLLQDPVGSMLPVSRCLHCHANTWPLSASSCVDPFGALSQVGVELEPSHPKNFKYLQLPIYDMPEQDIVASFPAAFAFIEAAMEGGKQASSSCMSHAQACTSEAVSTLAVAAVHSGVALGVCLKSCTTASTHALLLRWSVGMNLAKHSLRCKYSD